MNQQERLIAMLAGELTPVVRWRPAWLRALCWGGLALPLGAAAVLAAFGPHLRLRVGLLSWPALAVAAVLGLGLASIAAAYAQAVPGRAVPSRRLAGAGLLSWCVLSWMQFLAGGIDPGSWGQGLYCYLFVLLAGAPMLAVFMVALARSRPLPWPRRAWLPAGLGTFYAATALLSLCHPQHASLLDLLAHLLAGLTLLAAARLGSALVPRYGAPD